MENVPNCPVCGSGSHAIALQATDHTVSKESFTICACAACGFHFTSPRPEQSTIGRYYLSDQYISHAAKASGIRDHIYRAVRQRTLRAKHALIAKYHASGTVLDVGCGTGDFLAYLHAQGYSTQGVEVSPDARAIAQTKTTAIAPDLDSVPSHNQFNVVTLWHVLEHVADPATTLRHLHALCSPGALLVIAVPDRESWDCNHYGPQWAAWDVPRHLSHFRRQDIRTLLQQAEFDLVEIRRMWWDAPYVAMLSEQYNGANPFMVLLKGATVGMWSNLMAFASGLPTSSSLYIAQKQ